HHHDADEGRRRERSEKPGGQQEPARGLGDAGERRMEAAGPEPELLHERRGAGDAPSPEPTEQLLTAVTRKSHSDDQTRDQDSQVHGIPPWRQPARRSPSSRSTHRLPSWFPIASYF